MKLHYLNNHANKEERKKRVYTSEDYDFGNFAKGLFNLHMQTRHNITFSQNSP